MPDVTLDIQPMLPRQARCVAEFHQDGIPQGFLSSLGTGVRAHLYRGIANASRSGVWVALDGDGQVIGFIAGTANVERCYRAVLLRRGLAMAWHAAPALLHGSTWRQILETLLYPRRQITRARETSDPRASEPTAELLAIVVSPSGRGTGAALGLVATLEAALAAWGHVGSYRVVTMAADPRSNAFYKKVGFQLVRGFHHHGVPMNLYHKDPSIG